MKITYLVKSTGSKDFSQLAVASKDEWQAIMAVNRSLPPDQRRYFEIDYIRDGNEIDIMYIEVSQAEHSKWNKAHTAAMRNQCLGEKYLKLSLDAPSDDDSESSLGELIPSQFDIEAESLNQFNTEQIRQALRKWNVWAEDLLDIYLAGNAKSSAYEIAERYGVSSRQGRTYKKQFEEFLKNFLF